jgi:hypothetical protein
LDWDRGTLQLFRGSEIILIDDKDTFEVDPLGLTDQEEQHLRGLFSLLGGFRVEERASTPDDSGKIWELTFQI